MNNNYIKLLLEPNLYIGKDFNNLRKLFFMVNKKVENEEKEKNEYNKKTEELEYVKINPIKKEKIDNNKEKNNKPNLLLHDLFRIYSNISDEKKELLKDDEDYKRF